MLKNLMATISGKLAPALPGTKTTDLNLVNRAMCGCFIVTFIILMMVGHYVGTYSAVFLWSASSLVAGASLGFLFAVPRVGSFDQASRQTAQPSPVTTTNGLTASTAQQPVPGHSGHRPNSNLEEVSDWLTKIIVGLGLIHLKDIKKEVVSTAENAAASLAMSSPSAAVSTATALIVCMAILGFFVGYIYTRMFLQVAFVDADMNLFERTKLRLDSVLETAAIEVLNSNDAQAAIPSVSQVQVAQQIKDLSYSEPRPAIERMQALAQDYVLLRENMGSSSERTRKMSEISQQMTFLALGAESHLSNFAKSEASGERLAAVMTLKMKFNPNYIAWLAERLVKDMPFIGFHAAGALLAATQRANPEELQQIERAVTEAKNKLISRNMLNDPPRDRLIEAILKSGSAVP